MDRDSILRLSNEVLGAIVQYMDTRTLKHFGSTSIRLREVAEIELWKSLTIVFLQLPMTRTTRLRVERNKALEFIGFCQQKQNSRLLQRVRHLRLSVPFDISWTPGDLFEPSLRWFVDEISHLFTNLAFLEVFSFSSDKSSRVILNPLLELPVPKHVDLWYPEDSSTFPPVGPITNCEKLVLAYPDSVDLGTLLEPEGVRDVRKLELACESYTKLLILGGPSLDPLWLNNNKLKELKISRAAIWQTNDFNWIPPRLEKLILEDVSLAPDQLIPPAANFENIPEDAVLVADSIKYLEISSDILPDIKTNILYMVSMPSLETFTTNGDIDIFCRHLPKTLKHLKHKGQLPQAAKAVRTTNIKSFEMFLGHVDENSDESIAKLAEACALSVTRLGLCIIPPFGLDTSGGANALVKDIHSGYVGLVSIIRTFINKCPQLEDFFLIDPEGMESYGLNDEWLVPLAKDDLHLGAYNVEDKEGLDEYRIDISKFKMEYITT